MSVDMTPFHDHLLPQLEDALRRGVVLLVDPPGAFRPFLADLTGHSTWSTDQPVPTIQVGARVVRYVEFTGSWFGLRAMIEDLLPEDGLPDPPVLVYIAATLPPSETNPLMEYVLIGPNQRPLQWDFDREARACMRAQFTETDIDGVLADGRATWDDVVVHMSSRGNLSRLKPLFPDKADPDILLAWLAEDRHDKGIADKKATTELYRLVGTRLGLEVPDDVPLAQARARVARFVMVTEFRHDLDGDPPSSISQIPSPGTEVQRDAALALVARYRETFPEGYILRADQVEQELRLAQARLAAQNLGHIDTFRFEERALLDWCADLLAKGRYSEALEVVVARGTSFWVDRDVERKAQWELCRRVGELGLALHRVKGELPSGTSGPETWVERYADKAGWHGVDAMQRALETWRNQLSEEPVCETAIHLVLRAHERLLHEMAERFTRVLLMANWAVPGVMPQARIHPDVVAKRGGAVAFFVVDALRFEMGVELARLLDGADELQLQPAIAALPSITPVGMAALLPGASAHFSVVADKKGQVAALVDEAMLSGIPDRQKYLAARVPDAVDLALSKVLQYKPSELKERVSGRSLVLVRSTEIDAIGETGDDTLARQYMGGVLGNIVRAVRKLNKAGLEHFVIAADHGHLFGLRKGDDMKTDAPGGETVGLHRRCWIGRGGTTPPGTLRVPAAQLGYASDLDFVFPMGLGVLKGGGDLSYHHGGTSLQEMVIPVLSFRLPASESLAVAGRPEVRLTGLPARVTNRIFPVTVQIGTALFGEPLAVRVVVLAGAEQVGQAGMAVGAAFDRETGTIRAAPGQTVNVGVMLAAGFEGIEKIRLVVLEPETGAVLAESKPLEVSLMR